MSWIKFEKAAQVEPGVRMQPESTVKRPGRYKGYVVLRRESHSQEGYKDDSE